MNLPPPPPPSPLGIVDNGDDLNDGHDGTAELQMVVELDVFLVVVVVVVFNATAAAAA